MDSLKWVSLALIALGIVRVFFPVQVCLGGYLHRMIYGTVYWPWQSCPIDPRGLPTTSMPAAAITAVQALILIGLGLAVVVWRRWGGGEERNTDSRHDSRALTSHDAALDLAARKLFSKSWEELLADWERVGAAPSPDFVAAMERAGRELLAKST